MLSHVENMILVGDIKISKEAHPAGIRRIRSDLVSYF